MPKGKTATMKQRKFAVEYAKTGNGVQSALKAYDTTSPITADSIARENLAKPRVIELIQAQAEYAMLDQIDIRNELKQSKKDYAVRASVNRDILDRAGFRPPDTPQVQVNIGLSVDL